MEISKKIEGRAMMGASPEVAVNPPQQEADFHIMLEAMLETIVTGPDGKVKHHQERKAESFLRAFIELLYAHAIGAFRHTAVEMRDTSDALQYIIAHTDNWYMDYDAADDVRGIIVGTGSTAPNISDHWMETPIASGAGLGQLGYSAMAVGFPGINANMSQITITRSFANATGALVTVHEIGVVTRAYDRTATPAVRYFLILRDVIPAGISVPDGDTLTVNYRLQAEA